MNAVIQTGYVIETTYVNGIAVCEINSDMSPNLTYTGFFQYLQPGVLCNIPNNTKVALAFSPHKHVGGVIGAVNIIPDGNTTLSDVPSASPPITNSLKPGEVALVNIANFNYSIQAKLDGLYAIFKNDNVSFKSNTFIAEAIVDILQDIISEFTVIKTAINTHLHSAGGTLTYLQPPSTVPVTVLGWTGTATINPAPPLVPPVPPSDLPYKPTDKLVQTDKTYLDDKKCYVADSGEYPIK